MNVWLLLALSILGSCAASVVDVCSSDSSCVDINTALSNLGDNTELRLQEGSYVIEQAIFVSNLSNITISGLGRKTILTCAEFSGFIFDNVCDLVLAGLTIRSCGISGQILDRVELSLSLMHISINRTGFYGLILINSYAVTMRNVTITESNGLGLLSVNIMKAFQLLDTTFSNNGGGGAVILYSDPDPAPTAGLHSVDFKRCQFINNINLLPLVNAYGGPSLLSAGGGLTVILASTSFPIRMHAEGCTFDSNKAKHGGGVHLSAMAGLRSSSVQFHDCTFRENCLDCQSNFGGALYLVLGLAREQASCVGAPLEHVQVDITNCHFVWNNAYDGAALYQLHVQQTSALVVRVRSCLFEGNTATLASAISAHFSNVPSYQFGQVLLVSVENTTIQDNKGNAGAVSINYGSAVLLGDNLFLSNQGSSLMCTSCELHVMGHNLFSNNTGTNGGALRLVAGGSLRLYNNSLLSLHNNTAAVYGGGVYAESKVDYCFLRVDANIFLEDCKFLRDFHTLVDFRGNKAPVSSMIYGLSLDRCNWISNRTYQHLYTTCKNRELLAFDEEPTGISRVTSPSVKLVVSDYGAIIPGGKICLNVSALDIFNQTVPDTVVFRVLADNGELLESSFWQTENSKCLPLVISGPENSTVSVEVQSLSPLSLARTVISVQLIQCLFWQVYEESSRMCKCPNNLSKVKVACAYGILQVPAELWLDEGRGEFEGMLVWGHRLKSSDHAVNITNSHFNSCCSSRSGLLCGACKPGFSVVLGSSRHCKKCSNFSLVILLVPLLFGVVIIVALAFFHISISDGHINSIFFYSSVLSIYATSLVPSEEWSVLFVVADLLNLKFNFNTCLYDGMQPLAVVLIQYGYVAYIFLLMGAVYLFASRWHLPGSHDYAPSKTVATLLLMCYVSLVNATAKSLSFARVYTLDGKLAFLLWREDTNLLYFKGVHSVLVVLALLVILCLLLPFTVLVIHPRCSYGVCCMARLKPIYDAVWAPFWPEARWWFGVRLLTLLVLSLCEATLGVDQGIFTLQLILAALLFVQSRLKPFVADSANFLDTSLLVVVLSLSFGATFSCCLKNRDVFQLTYTSVFVLLFYCVVLVVLTAQLRIRLPTILENAKALCSTLRRRCCQCEVNRYELFEEDTRPPDPVSFSEVTLAGLREDSNLRKEMEVVTTEGESASNVVNMSERGVLSAEPKPFLLTSELHDEARGDSERYSEHFVTCREPSHSRLPAPSNPHQAQHSREQGKSETGGGGDLDNSYVTAKD